MKCVSRLRLSTGMIIGSLLLCLPAFADPLKALPPMQTQGTVTYVSGGIGQDEAQAFAAAAKHYPLTLEFAIKHVPPGAFADDVHVWIRNAQGKNVLDTMSKGPFLLAKLPVGYYTVSTEHHGQTLTKTVRIAPAPARSVHVLFLWKSHF